MARLTKAQQAERNEAIEQLRKWLQPGDTVNCILRHVSRSGMRREIGLVIFKDGTDLHPNYLVSKALGWPQGKRDGVIVDGCGMDMGFHLVYSLSRTLFPDGFGVKSVGGIRPRDREHAAQLVEEGKTDFRGRNGDASGWDDDGGYALKHRWL